MISKYTQTDTTDELILKQKDLFARKKSIEAQDKDSQSNYFRLRAESAVASTSKDTNTRSEKALLDSVRRSSASKASTKHYSDHKQLDSGVKEQLVNSFKDLGSGNWDGISESVELGNDYSDIRGAVEAQKGYKTIYDNKAFKQRRYEEHNTEEETKSAKNGATKTNTREKTRTILSKSRISLKKSGDKMPLAHNKAQCQSSTSFCSASRPRTGNADIKRLLRAVNLRDSPFKFP
eukprot:TRINITY_DN7144_c0_g1_i1.p1 TRINITY_DN7144_c0_g1~~TRINITY_DN7144_c0_g1_i1.p1  ORF type:complete len:235 (+),score=42.08 TRINITY_DN7144_c0_g1_i1:546-1250(+)